MNIARSFCRVLGCLGYISALIILWFWALSTGNIFIIVPATLYAWAFSKLNDATMAATIFLIMLAGYVFLAHITNFAWGGVPFKIFLAAILFTSTFFIGEWLNGKGIGTLLKNDRDGLLFITAVCFSYFVGIEVGFLTHSWLWGILSLAFAGLLFLSILSTIQNSTNNDTMRAA